MQDTTRKHLKLVTVWNGTNLVVLFDYAGTLGVAFTVEGVNNDSVQTAEDQDHTQTWSVQPESPTIWQIDHFETNSGV